MDIENKWYRVKDRLPEIPEGRTWSSEVVARDEYGNKGIAYMEIQLDGTKVWKAQGYIARNTIVAWCPIPEYSL